MATLAKPLSGNERMFKLRDLIKKPLELEKALSLQEQGYTFTFSGEYQKAISCYTQALSILKNIGHKQGEAAILLGMGNVFVFLAQYDNAINSYTQALEICRQLNLKNEEGKCLGSLGNVYYCYARYEEARDYFTKALEIARQLKDKRDEGKWIGSLGTVSRLMGEYDKALEYYNRALVLSRYIRDRRDEGIWLGNIGNVYCSMAQYTRGIEYYQEALNITKKMKDPEGEETSLGNLGSAYRYLGQYEKALSYYEQALHISRQIGSKHGEGKWLCNKGIALRESGRWHEAMDCFNEGLTISKKIGDKKNDGDILTALGILYTHLGEYEKAMDYYKKALLISREIKDRQMEGSVLGNLGRVYDDLGDYKKAIEYVMQALQISREIKDIQGESIELCSLGNFYHSLHQFETALGYFNKALMIARQIEDQPSESSILDNMGSSCRFLRRYKEAIDYHTESLAICRAIDKKEGELKVIGNLGNVFGDLGEYEKAKSCYEQALSILKEVTSPESEKVLHLNLGIIHEEYLQNYEEAQYHYRQSIEITEAMRGLVIKQEHKAGLMSEGIKAYDRMILNLSKVGMHEEAIEYVERSKSQALVELLSKEEMQPKGNVPPDIIEEYEKVIFEYKEIKFRFLQATRSEDSNQLAEMKYRYEEVKKKLDTSVAKIKEYDTTFIPIIRIEPIKFATIENLVPKDNQTALIEFFVTDRKTMAFIVIPGRRLSETTIEIENFTLSDLANLLVKYDENGNPIDGWLYKYYDFKEKRVKYYENVSAYEEAWLKWENATEDMLRNIYEGLFQEIDKKLKNLGIRRIILIPHRWLHLLPLHAMFRENGNKREYLIDDYEISYGPSSHIVGLCQKKRRHQESLLAVANPDHTLKFTDNEVKTIASQFDHVEILWYEKATISAIVSRASKYDVLHFSCHGYFNPVEPMSSGLILADEDQTGVKVDEVRTRQLTLAEIFKQISLPITSMVVLSACETGMIKLDVSDEYVGLPSGFLYAGSPAVIGSLWEVDDLSTALLMGKFYENLRFGLMSKAAALKEAQRWLRDLTVEDITKNFRAEIDKALERILDEHSYKGNIWRNWEKFEKLRIILRQREYPKANERIFCHPYYWAAFFISGNGF